MGAVPAARRTWWSALALYLLVLGSCFTGFLLPMDQNAYWGTVVRLGIVESAPLVGGPAADLLRGGGGWNASTLPRFYALHVSVLPFLAVLLLLPLVSRVVAACRGACARFLGLCPSLALALGWLPGARPAGATAAPRHRVRAAPRVVLPGSPSSGTWRAQFWLRSCCPAAGLGFLFALPLLLARPGKRVALVGLSRRLVVLTALSCTRPAAFSRATRKLQARPWSSTDEARAATATRKGDGSQAKARPDA
jgi:hypothetical protein